MAPSFTAEELRRIEQTTALRDTDPIPKVADAGAVSDRDGVRVQTMHNGVLIREGCYHGAWMTEVIRRLRGHHEPQEEAAYHAIVQRLRSDTQAPVMVELGCFWAYYSLWARHAMPDSTCVMVEPDAANLQAGRENFALNGFDGRFVQAAVGRRHKARVWMQHESGSVRRTPTVTLDGLMADESLERIDLLLCDIQGGEVDMIAGAAATLAARRVRFMVVSTHHHRLTGDPLTHLRCLEALQACGAHIIAEHSPTESCSGDGLIAVSLDRRDEDLEVVVSLARARDSLYGELEVELAARMGVAAPARLLAARTRGAAARARVLLGRSS